MIKELWRSVLDVFYPGHCVFCDIKIPSGIFCGTCFSCIQPLTAPAYPCLFGAVLYREPMVTAVHRFKYRREIFLAPSLAGFLVQLCRYYRIQERVDSVIPVPLYPARRRERGFNQSELLAGYLANHFSLPLLRNCLKRSKNTPSQTGLSGRERLANVSGAFRVAKTSMVRGKSLLLVDDVLTTGATLNACRRQLLDAGAGEVYGMALARD